MKPQYLLYFLAIFMVGIHPAVALLGPGLTGWRVFVIVCGYAICATLSHSPVVFVIATIPLAAANV